MSGQDGFEELYRSEFKAVLRTAYLLVGSREEAMDLTQETFTRAYEHWKSVSRHEHPSAWLQRVVGNLSMSWHRRQRIKNRILASETILQAPEAGEPSLVDALRQLTPAQRVVVILRYYADQSTEDVARALGKSSGTVRALTSQAFSRLRPLLELKGVRP